MSEFDNARISVTLKAGTEFSAPWIVLHGDNASDILAQLNDENLGNLAVQVAKDAVSFQSVYQTARGGLTGQSAQVQDNAPVQQHAQQQSAAAIVGASVPQMCNHGPRTQRNGNYKSGPKTGKPYLGFFCPQPRGAADQCKPVFQDL